MRQRLSGIGGWSPRSRSRCRSAVADLGCGDGRTLVALRERFGAGACELIGVERREPELDAGAGRRPERGRSCVADLNKRAAVRGRDGGRRDLPQHARGADLDGGVPGRGRARARARRALPARPNDHDTMVFNSLRARPHPPARARVRRHPGGVDGLRRRDDRPQAARHRRAARRWSSSRRWRGSSSTPSSRPARPPTRRCRDQRRRPARPPPRARLPAGGVGGGPARARRPAASSCSA